MYQNKHLLGMWCVGTLFGWSLGTVLTGSIHNPNPILFVISTILLILIGLGSLGVFITWLLDLG